MGEKRFVENRDKAEWYKFDNHLPEAIELETEADSMDEFRKVAFYNHLIFKKKE